MIAAGGISTVNLFALDWGFTYTCPARGRRAGKAYVHGNRPYDFTLRRYIRLFPSNQFSFERDDDSLNCRPSPSVLENACTPHSSNSSRGNQTYFREKPNNKTNINYPSLLDLDPETRIHEYALEDESMYALIGIAWMSHDAVRNHFPENTHPCICNHKL